MLTRRNVIVFAGVLAAMAGLLAAGGGAALRGAQGGKWPRRPVTVGGPFAAGGPTRVGRRVLGGRVGGVFRPENVGGKCGGGGGHDRRPTGGGRQPRRLSGPARHGRDPSV